MKKIFLNAVGIILFLMAAFTGKAQKVYMKAEGTKTGIIKDQDAPSKFPDRIELTGYSFESSSPASTGNMGIRAAVGRAPRPPLTILKNNGQSSILFFNCNITNENLKKVVIEVYRTNPSGMEILEQTITLSDAVVTYYKQSFDKTAASADVKGPKDEIRFSYQKISFEYVKSGVIAEDNWNNN